jgi:putative copper export protein
MAAWLTPTVFFGVLGAVFVVLTLGIVNLVRTDSQARSRSNKLMRLRVLVQFVAIIVLVILGLVASQMRS